MKNNLLILCVFLSSCTYSSMEQDNSDASKLIQEDRAQIYQVATSDPLSVQAAMDRALKYNLDARIARSGYYNELSAAQLQKLNSLPDIKAQRDFLNRSNKGASSSQSVLTGRQSLVPSFSTDQSRNVDLLEANWDVLDAAINVYKSKSASDTAKIFRERYRKVEQNIAMDVFTSFWKAAIAQEMSAQVDKAIGSTNKMLVSINKAKENGDIPYNELLALRGSLIEKREQLISLQDQLSLSQIELKTLLSYPLSQELKLDVGNDWKDANSIMVPSKSIEEYVDVALAQRPEIKEEFYNKRISQRAISDAVLQTIPGFSILASFNRDENSFLQDNDWTSFSATVSQSITQLLTLPSRYKKAKSEEDLTDARRHALVAAVISQVYISKSLFDQRHQAYKAALQKYNVDKEKYNMARASADAGLIGGVAAINAELEYVTAQLDTYQMYSNTQSAFASFINTVGYDVSGFYNIAGYTPQEGGING